ncbi:MAG: DUF6077 domain-containing protein [Blautia sp.]|nr:DUF6077 domain-containing protein [Blautia sp.]MCM1199616.1 DUF6077 domain-containing protein [Bacteroides fragilis]
MTQVISLIFWLIAVPFCIGQIPVSFMPGGQDARGTVRNPGVTLLAGYLLMWSVFEAITIPAVILIQYHNFLFVLKWFMAAAILLSIAGILLLFLRVKREREEVRPVLLSALVSHKMSLEAKIEWGIFLALLGFQLYMAVTRTSFDGDDAYYVVQSLMAQQTGGMYKNLPYTGRSSPLDIRHALAVFPMWVAFLSAKAGLHATIVSHVVMPLLLIPLSYLVYYEIAKALFPSRRENVPVFMILMGMFQMFGNVSIYTNEAFFLTRTWQGKAVAGSFVIPMLFLLLLWLYNDEKEERGRRNAGFWIMLVCLNMTAGICSSIAVFLLAILLAVTAFCLMLVERDIRIPVRLGLTCIPNAVYVLLYLMLK